VDRAAGQGRQLSGRRFRSADGWRAAYADRHAALSAQALDRRPERCARAGIPEAARKTLTSKSDHALDIVRKARARGVRFSHVGVDAGYGKEPAFLRALDDANEVFVADVHRDQRIWTEEPGLHLPSRSPRADVRPRSDKRPSRPSRWRPWRRVWGRGTGRAMSCATARAALWKSISRIAGSGFGMARKNSRDAGIWSYGREVNSPKTLKYSLSNAPVDTSTHQLACMQGDRYWVERSFEDAKGECGWRLSGAGLAGLASPTSRSSCWR